ncbi:MAG: hypothetical protein A2Z83_03405 [Omnitrophica bacterium GWA2_52_8]|nr:MAG: hypothetical protein A2Z83_03405 [Omnitrophica bacterium GWA2_52_8]
MIVGFSATRHGGSAENFGGDFSKHSIPLNEIYDGGPPKDGIPALFDPEFVSADEADFLRPADRILGLEAGGEAKAYPIKILNWHELVNDHVGGKSVLVSYCPLCGTGMAYDAVIDGKRFLFGVSGKLYNSNVLFYDRVTESLWSQLMMEAVTGPMTGEKLRLLPLEHTTWADWKRKHPQTKALSLKTGHSRDYFRDPYGDYEQNNRIFFPVAHEDSRLSRKAWVVGVIINKQAKAYPLESLLPEVSDEIAGQKIRIEYDSKSRSAVVRNEQGEVMPSVQAYWFAWAAFYPETEL